MLTRKLLRENLFAVIVWMAVIFYLSHQPGAISNKLSGGIAEFIISTAGVVFPDLVLFAGNANDILRETAHFIVYFILGVLVINILRKNGMSWHWSIILTLGVCVFYAVFDEVHQLFIPGRNSELRDLLVNSVGASMGVGAYLVLRKGKEKSQRIRA